MVGMIISNGKIITEKKHSISNKKLEVDHLLSYRCPYCKNQMILSEESVFTRVNRGYEIWECKKCDKGFSLCFRELEEKK